MKDYMKGPHRMGGTEHKAMMAEINDKRRVTYNDFVRHPARRARELFRTPAYIGTSLEGGRPWDGMEAET